ncbi:hydantoinase/oxoprolinase family protein [Rubrobacter marinus]|uniref:Hydantoinase/oxoprolinase family protein n=1 Tax=Rubrobacter marinus TaxID=2653852 RepID=A0A6G8PW92_9ACTN|nr:hydantoinase/oxoprolinase family protein [Rubrobacter marinus]QIN78478.1 hydantoinase/oxoprolinase family protein [Rubrobacter marinus]
MKRIGVDVGGTFTDLIYASDEDQRILVHKTPTTPQDPSVATLTGVEELCRMAETEPASVDQVFHGTTIATNIVVEHNGAKVGMITTEGYRDILHIARHKKPLNFSNYQDLPWQRYPIVRRRYRLTVPERVLADGSVLVPLDEDAVRDAARRLKEEGCEAVAVCLLFSFVNPEHETKVRSILEEEFPEAYLSVSSEVLPQYREYERFSTVALNAYVGPKVARYVDRLDGGLRERGVRAGLHLMTSASGVATPQGAVERPVNLLMSGPIAGVVGGIWAGRQAGFDNVITLDVGGTSADIGLAQRGELRMKHLLDTRVGPYQAMIPMVDVDTIGAGGGSVAYVDAGGMFHVGPRSAGADPGPASYDRGGTEPTATDAMVELGRIPPDNFLGGNMDLRPELAHEAMERLGQKLDMSAEKAAAGALAVLVAGMVQSIEENSVRKGYDPRDFALVAGGGAGPMFAAEVGREVGTPKVVVPRYPGIMAAVGLLATDMVYEYVRTYYDLVSTLDRGRLQEQFAELEEEALTQLREDGLSEDRMVVERVIDCRYVGQGYELRVNAESGEIDDAWLRKLAAAFHDAHEREYSRRFEENDIQIVNVRVRGVGLMEELRLPEIEAGDARPDDAAHHGKREVWFHVDGELKKVECDFYDRELLRAGNKIQGPAVLTQFDTTIVVPPGLDAEVDGSGNVVIDCTGGEAAGVIEAAAEKAEAGGA